MDSLANDFIQHACKYFTTPDVRPVFTGAYSEVYTYGKVLEILKERLGIDMPLCEAWR